MGYNVDRTFVPEEYEPPPCTCGQPDRVHTSGCAITEHYRRCVLSVQGLLHAPPVPVSAFEKWRGRRSLGEMWRRRNA